MNEIEEMRASAAAAASLTEALRANRRAVREFTDSATQVQSAYTLALRRVHEALLPLQRSFQAVAAVALNAFGGVLEALRPAAREMARLVTGLFGVTVWKQSSKGIETTASALGKVAKSTRSVAQAQRDLYSFDRITRVSARGGASGSSGGRSGVAGGAGRTGEGVLTRLPGVLDDFARRAKEVLAQIWEPFHTAWKRQGKQTIKAAEDALGSVAQAVGAVGESWLRVWTGGAGERAVSTVLQIVRRTCQTVQNLAQRFREAWQAGGAGDQIMQGICDLCQSVLDTLQKMGAAAAAWSEKLDFSRLVQSFGNLVAALQPLVKLLSEGLNWAYQNVLLPLSGWVIQEAAPALINALAGAVSLLTGALGALRPFAQTVWENLLKPMGQWTGSLLTTGLNAVSGAFRLLGTELGKLPDGWESLKKRVNTFWEGIRNAMVGYANGGKNGVIAAFVELVTGVVNSLSQLPAKMGSLFQSVTGKVRSGLSGVKEAVTAPFKNGFNGVIELLNRVIRKINASLKFSWPAVKIAGQTVVAAGSVTLATLPTVSKLAEGGITTGPAFSLIGEAGREAVLPLERNTGWMDQLAERIGRTLGQSGETVVEVNIGGETLTRQVVRGVNDMTRRTGRCPIYI